YFLVRAFVPLCLCVSVFFTFFVFEQGRGGRGAAARQRSNKKVILAWADTRNGIGQHESVSHALAVIERLGYESGVYDTYIRTDSAIISKTPLMTTGQSASGGPSLANVDTIFFLGHREIDLTAQQKSELLSFVRVKVRDLWPHTQAQPHSRRGRSSQT